MGVVNVTPDSFSDGGLFLDAGAAVAHGLELVEQGAEILDVGGESTRPGAEPVAAEEELRRVLPVVEGLAAVGDAAQHLDRHLQGGRRARRAGCRRHAGQRRHRPARRSRDGGGGGASSGAECCLMHMLGEPRTMQREPRYGDVVDEVKAFLEERLAFAVAEGIPEERVLLDPGIGFGKTLEHNLAAAAPPATSSPRSGARCWWGPRARASSGASLAGRAGDEPVASRRRAAGSRARSPRVCWPTSAARACCACTTSLPCAPRSRWRLLRWARNER